jgi:GTP-binding protein EngB required for normal cell division
VGYTNAGKSTLFNAVTKAGVYAADQLFATLDTTSRRVYMGEEVGNVVMSDTVGFMRELPHQLVAAFRATLEETIHADLLLHVVDAASPVRMEQIEQVNLVLQEIGADHIPQILVWNKIDAAELEPSVERDEYDKISRVFLSARTGAGLDLLREAIVEWAKARRARLNEPDRRRTRRSREQSHPHSRWITLMRVSSLLKRLGLKLSLNDPRWGKDNKPQANEGKKPGEGPPDMEQLWRDFNQRLNGMFGQKRPDGGDGGDGRRQPPDAGGCAPRPAHRAVVAPDLAGQRFLHRAGRPDRRGLHLRQVSHTTGSGFNWRWPYPFQSDETVKVSQMRMVEIGYRGNIKNKQTRESLMLTDDENIIDIQFAVQFKLKDPVAWLMNNRDEEDTVRQVAETSIREIVGKNKMDFVLYEGRDKVAWKPSS